MATTTQPIMSSPKRMSRRSAIMGAAIAVLAVAWYLFRPELLFVNQKVNESFPAGAMKGGAMTEAMANQMAKSHGMFHDGAHTTKGSATLYELAGGSHVLRLT